MSQRIAKIKRKTKETDIELTLDLDGTGNYKIQTPVPFLTHMLEVFTKHSGFDLILRASGDTKIDDHHTVEDIGICLGEALRPRKICWAGISLLRISPLFSRLKDDLRENGQGTPQPFPPI